MIITESKLGGGAIEIGIRNDARELLAVVTHPCRGAKWFLHDMGNGKPAKFATKQQAIEAAQKATTRAGRAG